MSRPVASRAAAHEPSRFVRRCRAATVAAALFGLLTSSVSASEPDPTSWRRGPEGRAAVFTMARAVSLQPIGARELFRSEGASGQDEGRWSTGRMRTLGEAGPEAITRRIDNAWTLRLPLDSASSSFDVRLEVEAPDGSRGALVHPERPSSRLHVALRPLPAVVIDRDESGITWSGSALLTLDPRDAILAGPHRGRLVVTIHQY